jgi:hypothetical protein
MTEYRSITLYFLVCILAVSVSVLYSSDWSKRKITDAPKDIVDYFLRLPRCDYDQYRDTIDIFESRKEYLIPDDTCEVIVDIQNAYLQIRYLGDLEERLTVTYFKRADGTKIIAFGEYYMGGDCDYYYITFYEYHGGAWVNVTDAVLPEITFEDFWDENLEFPETFIPIDSNIQWDYTLPRFGTAILVTPKTLQAHICFDPVILNAENISGSEEYERVIEEYYTTVRGRRYRTIELGWDKQTGTFSIGGKREE